MTCLWIICFFLYIMVLAYQHASLTVWTIAIALYFLVVSGLSQLGLFGQIVLWTVFFIIAIPLNIKPLRRQLITHPLFSFYKKIKPSLSATESEALSIGTVGWEGQFFSGMPNWPKLMDYPAPKLTEEEQSFLDNEVNTLCAMINNWDITRRSIIPQEIWDYLRQQGFFGMIIPKEYGGKAFSALMHSSVITKVAAKSSAVATVIGVPNSLGPAELLLEYGTDTQKQHYLPRLAKGDEIPCFALTAPLAGSDAGAMPDHGVICKGQWEGQEILGIRLQFSKRYITLAPVATLVGLAFKLYDPEHLVGNKTEWGITCALIPAHTPGISIGRRHYPLTSAFPNGPIQGKDVFIPLDFIIGGQSRMGEGWYMLMERLSVGRAITLPSMSTGGAKMATFTSGAYAHIRKQFHLPVGKFEGVSSVLGRIAGHTYWMEAVRLFTVSAIDRGERPAIPSGISKYHVTELGRKVMNDAMDVHGGKGICMGPLNYLAQSYIEVPIAITVEGANILTRSMIIFGQGAMRCHPYLLTELRAAENTDEKQGLIDFDQALFAHLGLIISNKVRAFVLGLTGARFAIAPSNSHPALKRYYQNFTRFSAAFAFLADVTFVTLGAQFKRKENLSARLGDVLSMLYMGSAVLKHFENQEAPETDLPIVEWVCQTILYEIQTALAGVLNNFPNVFLAKTIPLAIFPLGRRFKVPTDALHHKVADLFMNMTDARYRLAEGLYLATDEKNMPGFINTVLEKVIHAEVAEKKLDHAIQTGQLKGITRADKIASALTLGVLTTAEGELIQQAEEAVNKIIAVNDFAPEELER